MSKCVHSCSSRELLTSVAAFPDEHVRLLFDTSAHVNAEALSAILSRGSSSETTLPLCSSSIPAEESQSQGSSIPVARTLLPDAVFAAVRTNHPAFSTVMWKGCEGILSDVTRLTDSPNLLAVEVTLEQLCSVTGSFVRAFLDVALADAHDPNCDGQPVGTGNGPACAALLASTAALLQRVVIKALEDAPCSFVLPVSGRADRSSRSTQSSTEDGEHGRWIACVGVCYVLSVAVSLVVLRSGWPLFLPSDPADSAATGDDRSAVHWPASIILQPLYEHIELASRVVLSPGSPATSEATADGGGRQAGAGDGEGTVADVKGSESPEAVLRVSMRMVTAAMAKTVPLLVAHAASVTPARVRAAAAAVVLHRLVKTFSLRRLQEPNKGMSVPISSYSSLCLDIPTVSSASELSLCSLLEQVSPGVSCGSIDLECENCVLVDPIAQGLRAGPIPVQPCRCFEGNICSSVDFEGLCLHARRRVAVILSHRVGVLCDAMMYLRSVLDAAAAIPTRQAVIIVKYLVSTLQEDASSAPACAAAVIELFDSLRRFDFVLQRTFTEIVTSTDLLSSSCVPYRRAGFSGIILASPIGHLIQKALYDHYSASLSPRSLVASSQANGRSSSPDVLSLVARLGHVFAQISDILSPLQLVLSDLTADTHQASGTPNALADARKHLSVSISNAGEYIFAPMVERISEWILQRADAAVHAPRAARTASTVDTIPRYLRQVLSCLEGALAITDTAEYVAAKFPSLTENEAFAAAVQECATVSDGITRSLVALAVESFRNATLQVFSFLKAAPSHAPFASSPDAPLQSDEVSNITDHTLTALVQSAASFSSISVASIDAIYVASTVIVASRQSLQSFFDNRLEAMISNIGDGVDKTFYNRVVQPLAADSLSYAVLSQLAADILGLQLSLQHPLPISSRAAGLLLLPQSTALRLRAIASDVEGKLGSLPLCLQSISRDQLVFLLKR